MREQDMMESGEGKEETLESAEAKQEERKLDEVTTTPESHVEATVDYKESEKVEAVFVDVVGTDKKVEQTDPPDTSEDKVESSGKGKADGDPATSATITSPESKVGTKGEKSEPDSKEGAVGVDSSPKTGSIEKDEEETTPDKLDATPITLPDKEGAKATPSKPDEVIVEKPEQARMGVEKETNLEDGVGAGIEIPGVEGLPEGDPFGQGGMGPDVDIGGEGQPDYGNIMPDFQETIRQAQGDQGPSDPGTIGGGPGSVHPKYGASGQGMVGTPKPEGGSQGGTSGSQGGTQGSSGGQGQGEGGENQPYQVPAPPLEINVPKPGSKKAIAKAEIEAIEAMSKLDDATASKEKGEGSQAAVDKAASNFHKAYRELEEQYIAEDMEAARQGKVLMPRPDGDEGDVEAPKSEEDIKREDMVVDPASFQGSTPSSGVSVSKHPGLVSDPAEPQDPDTPDGGIKTDRSLTTDPPGEELGKEKGKSDE